jgi:hypothetical protein
MTPRSFARYPVASPMLRLLLSSRLFLVSAAGALALAAGCTRNAPTAPPSRADAAVEPGTWPVTNPAGEAHWPFWPAAMRVHPATRTVRDGKTGLLVVEARVEFRDEFNAVTKASGQIRLDLHKGRSTLGDPMSSWNLDLRDVTVNRERFDDVTRTYLFRLDIQDLTLPTRATLTVYFLSADGATLAAEQELRPLVEG